LCTTEIKENDMKESEKLKEEEKIDRFAIASEKKKRYGLKKLNKEENHRLMERTERKIELAQAKSNYRKWHREERRRNMEKRN
jgi:hypothetical protein